MTTAVRATQISPSRDRNSPLKSVPLALPVLKTLSVLKQCGTASARVENSTHTALAEPVAPKISHKTIASTGYQGISPDRPRPGKNNISREWLRISNRYPLSETPPKK